MMKRLKWMVISLALVALVACGGSGGGSDDDDGGRGDFDFEALFAEEDEVEIVEDDEDAVVLRLGGDLFTFGRSTLRPEALPILDKFEEIFDEFPDADYLIEGHTDDRGSARVNLELTQDRAEALRDHFRAEVENAPPGRAFETIGRGGEDPIALNTNADGRALNKRVEVTITFDD